MTDDFLDEEKDIEMLEQELVSVMKREQLAARKKKVQDELRRRSPLRKLGNSLKTSLRKL